MDNVGFAPSLRPTQRKYVESRSAVEQPMLLQIIKSEARQTTLLRIVYRSRGSFSIVAAGGAHFDEDQAPAIEGDEIKLTVRASVIAGQDAVAEPA